MKLSVTVKPNAKHEKVEKLDEQTYRVAVNAPAKDGKANEAVIAALATYFKQPKSAFTVVRGEKTRHKQIVIS